MSSVGYTGIDINTILRLTASPIQSAILYVGILACQAEDKAFEVLPRQLFVWQLRVSGLYRGGNDRFRELQQIGRDRWGPGRRDRIRQRSTTFH